MFLLQILQKTLVKYLTLYTEMVTQLSHPMFSTTRKNSETMKKIIQGLCLIAAASMLTACVSYNANNAENGKRVEEISQRAIATCGQGNVDKVTTTGFNCKVNR